MRIGYNIGKYLHRNAPTILTLFGVAGVVATTVTAVRATPKAIKIYEEKIHEANINASMGDELVIKKTDIIKWTWKCYVPSFVIGTSTIGCILGANILNKNTQSALTSAYALVDQSYKQYRQAAKTVYGPDADDRIRAEVAKKTYVSSCGLVCGSSLYDPEYDKSEEVLFYDWSSRRYFTSTLASVINAQYHFCRNLMMRGEATLNEFYEFLGIDPLPEGGIIGWGCEFFEGGVEWLDFDNEFHKMDDGMDYCIISPVWEPELLISPDDYH